MSESSRRAARPPCSTRTRTASWRPRRARPRSCSTRTPTATLDPMRHSAAHVMAEAVMDLFPGTQLGIGPAIDDGFYYDFDLPRALTPDDLAAIEARMRAVRRGRPPVRAEELPPDEGRPSSRSATSRTRSRSSTTSPPAPRRRASRAADDVLRARPVHRPVQGPPRRVHGQGRARSSCCRVAGAYWRGDEQRPMLQRIYGTVWATQEELDRYLWRREEARKRDHRRLGVAARPVQLPRRLPGLGLLAPQGPEDLAHARVGDARAPGAARLPGGRRRRSSSTASSGSSRGTGTTTATTCSRSSPRARRSASSR